MRPEKEPNTIFFLSTSNRYPWVREEGNSKAKTNLVHPEMGSKRGQFFSKVWNLHQKVPGPLRPQFKTNFYVGRIFPPFKNNGPKTLLAWNFYVSFLGPKNLMFSWERKGFQISENRLLPQTITSSLISRKLTFVSFKVKRNLNCKT